MIIANSARPVVDLACNSIEIGSDHTVVIADGDVGPGVQRYDHSSIVPCPSWIYIRKGPLDMTIWIKRHLILTFSVDNNLPGI